MLELINISLIYSSKRKNDDVICTYCRNDLDDICGFCTSTNKDCTCTTVIGICSHEYHKHCIESWIKRVPLCPLCKSTWKVDNKLQA